MNNELSKAISKQVQKSDLGGSQELTPGVTGRRYEPIGGEKNHNKRIHRESEFSDKHKDLPFTFSKPKKSGRSKVWACSNCNNVVYANINTKGIICSSCKTYAAVKEVIYE